MNAKVSIVVPVYNSEEYIDHCICSLVQQTYKNIEIIVVDDASTDKSLSICKRWESNNSIVKVIANNHEGVSQARNVGINNSSGDWIVFVDSDDFAEPQMIESMIAHSYGFDIVIGGYYAVKKNSKEEEHFYYGDQVFDLNRVEDQKLLIKDATMSREGNSTNIGVPWGKLYKKKIIEDLQLRFVPGLSRMQDMIFNLSAFVNCLKIKYIDEPIYNYRLRDSSVTSAYKPDFHETAFKILVLMERLLNGISDEEYAREVVYAKKASLLVETVRLELLHKEAPPIGFREKMRKIREYKKAFFGDSVDIIHEYNGTFLTKNKKIVLFFIYNNMEWMFYGLYFVKSVLTRVGHFD